MAVYLECVVPLFTHLAAQSGLLANSCTHLTGSLLIEDLQFAQSVVTVLGIESKGLVTLACHQSVVVRLTWITFSTSFALVFCSLTC